MHKSKRNKGFASPGQPIYTKEDFLDYFEKRIDDMIRNEIEEHFKKLMYRY